MDNEMKLIMKKDLQKMCKKFREELLETLTEEQKSHLWGGRLEYPKAILTQSQMRLNTASINCGRSENKRDYVLQSEAFKEFVEKYNIKMYCKEITSFKDFIVRLRY